MPIEPTTGPVELTCQHIISREYVGRRGTVWQQELCGKRAYSTRQLVRDGHVLVRCYCYEHTMSRCLTAENAELQP